MGQPDGCESIIRAKRGGKPGELKHLITRRKRKQKVIARVVASESARAQTGVVTATAGVVGPSIKLCMNVSRTAWKRRP